MGVVTHEQLRGVLLDALENRLQNLGIGRDEIVGSFDLFGSEVLDSIGFVDLLTLMEERLSISFDFDELDFSRVETVDSLLTQLVELQQESPGGD
jgi:acyl carrier protein